MTDATEESGLVWEDNELFATVAIDDGDSPYSIVAAEDVILADATSGAITVNLPALASNLNRAIWIKDIGDGSNDVTLDGDGAEQVEGAATYLIPTGGGNGVMVIAGASQWHVIAAVESVTSIIEHANLMSAVSLGF